MFLCIVAVGKEEQERIISSNSEKCKAFQLFRFLVFQTPGFSKFHAQKNAQEIHTVLI